MNNYNVADWESYYRDLQNSCSIPDAACQVISTERAVFRGMYLDLNKIYNCLYASSYVPKSIEIYADFLQVNENLNWDISSNLFIFSRQINVLQTPVLIIDTTKNLQGAISIIANEINGSITAGVKTLPVQNSVQYKIEQGNSAVAISVKHEYDDNGKLIQSTPQSLPITAAAIGSIQYLEEDIQTYLNNSFIYATLLYDQNPLLALSIFKWVRYCATGNNQLNELFLRADSVAALLCSEIAAGSSSLFVPFLSKEIYTGEAKAFAKSTADYESKYLQLFALKTLTDENIETAKAMLDNQGADVDYINTLLTQAKADYQSALQASEMAYNNFKEYQLKVSILSEQFISVGLPAYQRDETIETVFNIINGIVSLGIGITEMVVGDEGAAPAQIKKNEQGIAGSINAAEAGSISSGVGEANSRLSVLFNNSPLLKNIADGVKFFNDVKKGIQSFVDTNEKLMSGFDNLVKYINEVDQLYDTAIEIYELVKDNIGNGDITAILITGTTAYPGDNESWTEYEIQMNDLLAVPVNEKVMYASDYKEALDILVIYGKALTNSKLAVNKACSQVTEIATRLYYADAKRDNFKKLADKLSADETMPLALMHYFYQKYLDNKNYLFLTIKNYQASYFYWALQASTVDAKITDKANEISSGLDKISGITMDNESALKNFDPPPQVIENILFTVNDENVLSDLKNKDKRKATVIIPLDATEFAGHSRVRISTIRVWLDGIAANATVQLKITNSGNFSDRLNDNNFNFISQPLVRSFEYGISNNADNSDWKFENNTYAVIKMDGKIDEEVEFAYFEPTAFSHWSIEVKNYDSLDLSNLNKVTFYFKGSAIGQ